MNLEEKVRGVISRSPGSVVLRTDVSALGSRSQVSLVLSRLQKQGELIRMGQGIYAKSCRDPVTDAITPVQDFESLALEALGRLGHKVWISPASQSRAVSESGADNPVEVCVSGGRRIHRKLSIGKRSVVYVYGRERPEECSGASLRDSKTGDLNIPTVGVGHYVLKLAESFKVSYMKTYADEWAEHVSRLAGDDVHTDPVEQLVIALKKQNKVTGSEMRKLLTNYLREKERV
ncbi:DUF6088 family protein [Pseudomonas capsici]|uniref:DUF6088 family protein n=1 Tax=Pseudomonas capsici TaxID=2810614 RepID=A0ABT3BYL2_9PSED|nr:MULTISPECIES: DUF6088 family protein [Pseudomonas]MBN6714104.1 hypothetical protein [Pseudomonas capsici]MBN6719340.1 hypothetical protein [Pseudomonas capsici]MBN6722846.1 hypothetical protein [Pseudomonas capsici]MCV4267744.1 DUF6088 family protein [Pseudomonas capsici]MCV4278561.1 DUF6088 family protein [Pseudomonas capsici]